MIKGVELKQLITHTDERGYFRELIRKDDISQFGQWSMSMMMLGVIKAWHIHTIQTDYWYIPPFGAIHVALYDNRKSSKTFDLFDEFSFGDLRHQAILTIPPGVAHGLKVLRGPAYLFYITSHTYNPDDEGRIPLDEIDYDWGK